MDEQAQSGDSKAHLFVFTNEKAGMGQVDKGKVNQVVYEMSKNSAFFAHASEQDKKVDARVDSLKKKVVDLRKQGANQILTGRVASMEIALEKKRWHGRVCVVVDMDCFFAAVETRDNPALNQVPMAVGGTGMICTANYLARSFGVRAAMPGFIARKLCPQLVFVKPDSSKYKAASCVVAEVLKQYDEHCRMHSLDEAYLDLTSLIDERLAKNDGERSREEIAAEVVEKLRKDVTIATKGLTCSAGIACNFMVAKIASDKHKPNGQCLVPFHRQACVDFLYPMPIRKVGGVGKVLEKTLQEVYGVRTVRDLFEHRFEVVHTMTPKLSEWLLRVCLAIHHTDEKQAHAEWDEESSEDGGVKQKGISCERTFSALGDPLQLQSKLVQICDKLSSQMKEKGLSAGKGLTLKLKTAKFEVRTRSVLSSEPIETSERIQELAMPLLMKEMPVTLRLLGVRISHFPHRPTVEPGQRSIAAFVSKKKEPRQDGESGDSSLTELHFPFCGTDRHDAAHDSFVTSTRERLVDDDDREDDEDDCLTSPHDEDPGGGGGGGGWVDKVDQSILAQLPEEIRREVETEMKKHTSIKPEQQPRTATLLDFTDPSAPVKKRRGFVDCAEVDQAVLNELPEAIQSEIREQMQQHDQLLVEKGTSRKKKKHKQGISEFF